METPQQNEVLSLHRIDRLPFVRKTVCVHCAVRTGFLNIIQVKFSPIGYAMVQEVSRQSLNSGSVFDTMSDHTRFVVAKVKLGRVFLPIILYCQYNSPDVPYSSSTTCSSYHNDKREYPRKLPKNSYLPKIGENWIENRFNFFQSYHCLFHLTRGQ